MPKKDRKGKASGPKAKAPHRQSSPAGIPTIASAADNPNTVRSTPHAFAPLPSGDGLFPLGTPTLYGGRNDPVLAATLARFSEENRLQMVFSAVAAEVRTAKAKWPPFNSAHEAFAVLDEERCELRQHVHTKQANRDLAAMRKEAIQVAAMAVRFALEVCTEEVGRK